MKVERSALLPYSAMQMYEIVADIEAYPDFLNWCTAVELIEATDDQVVAKLKIAYRKLNMAFTTRNLNRAGESIALSLVDGPFTQLSGLWRFSALNNHACKVSIVMEFHFRRSTVSAVFSRAFEKTICQQLDAFQSRAAQLHGTD